MLSEQEIEGLRLLLCASELSSLELGLELLRPHKILQKRFLPLLLTQKLLWDSQNKDLCPPALNELLKFYPDKELIYQWQQRLVLVKHSAQATGKTELLWFKRKEEDIYNQAKAEFLGCLGQIQPVLEQSSLFIRVFSQLAHHFLYEDNDYLLATELVYHLYKKEESYETMGMLGRLLGYYLLPNGKMQRVGEKSLLWLRRLAADEQMHESKRLYARWLEGIMMEGQGRKDLAGRVFADTLAWAEDYNQLKRFMPSVFGDIYHNLSVWAAETGDLTAAESNLKLALNYRKEETCTEAMVWVLKLQKQPAEAVKLLKKAIKRRAVTELYYVLLADLYVEMKNPKKAIEAMITCVEISPQYLIYTQKLLGLLRAYAYPNKEDLIAQYEHLEAEISGELEDIEQLFG